MFTRESLDKLHELTAAVNSAKEQASELLRTAQDRYNTKVHKLTRDGKEVELTEKVLWDEVFYLGPACESGTVLKREHPEVFEAYKRQDDTANELKRFCIVELGIDYTQLTLSDYLRATEGMFDLLMAERIAPEGQTVSIETGAGTSGTAPVTTTGESKA
jgi:hypothetical protein